MKYVRRCCVVLVVGIVGSVMQAWVAEACVGARPLSMGGAFIAIADDANAVYWNPAGLTQLEGSQSTYMRTMNNRETLNYQDFGAYVSASESGAFGVSYIDAGFAPEDSKRLILSAGFKVGRNTALGVNVRQSDEKYILTPVGGSPFLADVETDIGFDATMWCRLSEQLTLGVLVQDINEPAISYQGQEVGKWARNVRPGVAFRPDPTTVLAVDVYNMTESGNYPRKYCLGVEKWVNANTAVRAGSYQDNKTFGLGFRTKREQVDLAYMGDDLGGTWLLSSTTLF